MTDNFIILQDGEIKGYLTDEKDVKNAVSELARNLAETVLPTHDRVFQEITPTGVSIYTQSLGKFLNGPVVLQNTITWKAIPVYKN